MVRSYSQTWFITKDNVRRTNTREKRLWKTKNMFLDWSLKTEEDKISYDELKMLAQDRWRWCQWRWKPAKWAEYYSRSAGVWQCKHCWMVYVLRHDGPLLDTTEGKMKGKPTRWSRILEVLQNDKMWSLFNVYSRKEWA